MTTNQAAAFERAAEARRAIADIVSAARTGRVDLSEAFSRADSDPLVGRCFAVKVFEALPGIGKVRARRTMEALGIDESAWLDQVPADKRSAILEAFAEAVDD